MRSPLSSRTNSRPQRATLDGAVDLVTSSTVMVFPSVTQLRLDAVPLASTSLQRAPTYSAATDVVVLVKFGGRFSRNAENASFASAERARSKNSWSSILMAALI